MVRTRAMLVLLGVVALGSSVLVAPVGAQLEPSVGRTPVGVDADGDDVNEPSFAPDDRPSPPPRSSDRLEAEALEASGDPADADTVVVTFRDDRARPASVDGQKVETVPTSDLAVLDVPDGRDAIDFAIEVSARPDVESAEPNITAKRAESAEQTGEFERIGIDEAWTRSTGSADVVVAVVDSGIDPAHPDLAGRLVPGYNWAAPGTYPVEALHPDPLQFGHGTKVAGVIAAAHGSGTSIEGVAGAGTKIMPLRVFPDGTGGAPLADIAAAIDFAANNGADIVNLSLAAAGQSNTIDAAVLRAVNRGVVVLAAAGNEGTFLSNSPANSPYAVGVSATDDNGDTVSFTTFGPDVDIAAPGLAIDTIAPGGGTTTISGTSFATPMVAGVAALLKARHPGWDGDRIVAELFSTAEDRGPTGLDDYYGFGLVDAAAALGVAGRAPFVGVGAAALDSEPNDVSSRSVAAGSVNSGVIAPEGDVDWWSFSASAGSSVTVTMTPPVGPAGPQLDGVLDLHGPNGSLIETVDATFDGEIESVTFDASSTGTHRVSVRNYRGTISPGAYTLEIGVGAAGATSGAEQVTAERAASFGSTGPWLESTTPVIRATGVSRTANLSVRSGRDLASATVGSNTVVLVDGVRGSLVPSTVGFSTGSDTITVNPTGSLLRGRPYLLLIAGVQDTSGDPMPWTTVPFSTAGEFASPNISGTYDPVVGDFSGDGATDILYYAPGGTPDYLHLGDWSGMVDAGPFPVNGTYEPFTLDLDGNGQDDIIWYAPGPAADYIWYAHAGGFVSEPTSAKGRYEPFTLDLNGDGFDDIVWYAPGRSQDYLWYGKAGGGHTSVPITSNGVYEPFVGDFNDDGFDDTFWYAPGGASDFIWYGKPTGHTSVPTTVNGHYRPVSGDFDADGYGDVLFYAPGTAPDFQWLFRPGGFDSVSTTINGTYLSYGGDFNGDRYDDVLLYGPGSTSDTILLGGPAGL